MLESDVMVRRRGWTTAGVASNDKGRKAEAKEIVMASSLVCAWLLTVLCILNTDWRWHSEGMFAAHLIMDVRNDHLAREIVSEREKCYPHLARKANLGSAH